jgi:hypothetical protein
LIPFTTFGLTLGDRSIVVKGRVAHCTISDGHRLARLSSDQIRDAFKAAWYSAQESDDFTAVLESRIAPLNQL